MTTPPEEQKERAISPGQKAVMEDLIGKNYSLKDIAKLSGVSVAAAGKYRQALWRGGEKALEGVTEEEANAMREALPRKFVKAASEIVDKIQDLQTIPVESMRDVKDAAIALGIVNTHRRLEYGEATENLAVVVDDIARKLNPLPEQK